MGYCHWCKEDKPVRHVWMNTICQECEVIERQAGRSLITTSPVKDAYWVIKEVE